MNKIIVYFDGGTHNKRVSIVDVNDGYKIRVWENLKARTNNEFEFMALLKALQYVHSEYGTNAKNVKLYGDSRNTIDGINHNSKFTTKNLRRFQRSCENKIKQFRKPPTLNWISRDENLAGFVLEMLYNKRRRLSSIEK